jgi:C_GCAxxG_C_C family probable redox protein
MAKPKEDKLVLMEPKERAPKLFEEGYLCSQSILMAYAPLFDLDRETAARLGASFGGGVARRGETCGAVNGACMVLGLKFGHTTADDLNSKERTYQAVQEFISQFQTRNGFTGCNQLLGLDISTAQGLQKAHDSQLFSTRCPGFVTDAAEILNQLLEISSNSSIGINNPT